MRDMQTAAGTGRQPVTPPDCWQPLTRCDLPDSVSSLRHQWFELRAGNPAYRHLAGAFAKRGARVLVNPHRYTLATSAIADALAGGGQ